MIYTIFAAVSFGAALYLIMHNLSSGSLSAVKYMGETYSTENEPILCDIERVSWINEDVSIAHCIIPESKDKIEIPYSLKGKNIPSKIWLIKAKLKDGIIYYPSKLDFAESANFDLTHIKKGEIMSDEEVEKKNLIIIALYMLAGILLSMSFFALITHSILSILFSLTIVAVVSQNVPLKHWTKNPNCSIIKVDTKNVIAKPENILNETQSDSDKPPFPVGYSNWSDTEKELFDIDLRLKDFSLPEEDSLLTELIHEEDEDFSTMKPPAPNISQEKTSSLNACGNCGCVVETNGSFCSHCGHNLKTPKPVQNNPKDLVIPASEPAIQFSSNEEPQNNAPRKEPEPSMHNGNNGNKSNGNHNNKKMNHRYRQKPNNKPNPPSELSNVIAVAENSLF